MCVNYQSVTPRQLTDHFRVDPTRVADWKEEIWQDYLAPVIVAADRHRQVVLGSYGMIPKRQFAPGMKRYNTMNARAETIASLPSYARPWHTLQFCLVPMNGFYEPNYESGRAERWLIRRFDTAPFAVAGLYRTWPETDGQNSFSFTQITINAETHPVMQRFHRPGDEKRALVVLTPDLYDEWLHCTDVRIARQFLRNCAPDLLSTEPALRGQPVPSNLALF